MLCEPILFLDGTYVLSMLAYAVRAWHRNQAKGMEKEKKKNKDGT